MTAIAIDIETLPLAAALALPYPEADRQPPGNYKTEEAITKWRTNDRAEWEAGRIKTYSLNPRFGRVAAVGFWTETWKFGQPEVVDGVRFAVRRQAFSLTARTEAEEAELLCNVWAKIGTATTLLTWNGLAFDLPFLVQRSILVGITPPRGLRVADYLRRYSTTPHCDVKQVLLNWPSGHPKGEGLGEWAEALGLGGKTAHGSEVYAMAERGEWDAISQYAADDARLTYQIAERVAPWVGIDLD